MNPSVEHPHSQSVRRAFQHRFGGPPEVVVFSPGRINLIGEHTDYNHGYVLPAAIQYGTWFAAGKSVTENHEWVALDKNETITIPVGSDLKYTGWQGYLHGGLLALSESEVSIDPVNCVFSSDLPIGAGLSSSSALTCGFLLVVDALFGLGSSRESLALIAHHVERDYIGLQGGIMDQHASLLSKEGHFLLLDCLDCSYQHIPFENHGEVYLFLINTGVQHELTTTEYNTRSSECRRALALLHKACGMDTLREIMGMDLSAEAAFLPEVLLRRILFVQRENQRVQAAVAALYGKAWKALGELLLQSHNGLRDDYEVSCPELDFLVELAQQSPDILGARMMGGGFGGCTLNLTKNPPDSAFVADVCSLYRAEFGLEPAFISVTPGHGGRVFLL